MIVYLIDRWQEGIVESAELQQIDAYGFLSASSRRRGDFRLGPDDWRLSIDDAERAIGARRQNRIRDLNEELDRLQSLRCQVIEDVEPEKGR